MSNDRKEQSTYKIRTLEKAVITLEKAMGKPIGEDRTEIDSCVLRFNCAIEVAWKTLKVVLLEKYKIEVKSPRSVVEAAFQQDLIDGEEVWLAMLDDRNEAAHLYDQEVGDRVYEHIVDYFPVLWKTMLMLKELSIQQEKEDV